MRKVYLIVLLLMALALALAACGPAGGDEGTSDGANGGLITTESGLQYEILTEGTGAPAEPGSRVTVHYVGTLEDGTQFDSSYDRGQPFSFVLGQGSVIAGWDEGIALLNVGSKARLIVPPELGYGEAGSGGTIPPNATLTFEVELLEVVQPAKPEAIADEDYTVTDSGLKYYDIETGTGESPSVGQPVRIHFAAWLEDGTLLADSREQGQPLTFLVGNGDVLPGWDEGVLTMMPGGIRQLVIPPALAFGEESPGGQIPANATIITRLELVETLEPGPTEPPEVAEEDLTTTESGLQYYDLEVGSGDPVEVGQNLTLQYTGWLTDGTRFDSSYSRGTPLPYTLGSGQAIPGWDEGLVGMNIGGRRLLIIPASLAYGAEGFPPVIPPNATLIFEVEIVGIGTQ